MLADTRVVGRVEVRRVEIGEESEDSMSSIEKSGCKENEEGGKE